VLGEGIEAHARLVASRSLQSFRLDHFQQELHDSRHVLVQHGDGGLRKLVQNLRPMRV